MEDTLEARKFNILLQAVTLDRNNGKEVSEFNDSWSKLYDILTGRNKTSPITEKEEENLKQMFKRLNEDSDGPRKIKMRIGKPDKSAEFDNKSITDLVKISKGEDE